VRFSIQVLLGTLLCVCVSAAQAGMQKSAWTDTASMPLAKPTGTDSLSVPMPSRALNIAVIRSLKKPVGRLQPSAPTFWTGDFLTGDWSGVRSTWMDKGVELMFVWYNDVYANVSGGAQTGAVYYGVGITSFDVYAKRAGLWENGQLHLTTALTTGRSLAYEYIGSINATEYYDNAFADGMKLFEAWYEQTFLEKALAVRVGMIYPYVQFGALSSAGFFQNGAFQTPSFLGSRFNGTLGTGFATSFIGAPLAVQARFMPHPSWQFMAQIQDGYVDPSGGYAVLNRHGVNPRIKSSEGAEILLQTNYLWNQTPGTTGLPGMLSAGMQVHSSAFADLHMNTSGQSLALAGGTPRSVSGNMLWYVLGEHTLGRFADGRRSVTAFAKVTKAVESVNPVSLSLAAGLTFSGPIPSRPGDALSIGYARSKVARPLADLAKDSGNDAVSAESVFEVNYSGMFAPWLLARPCMQWIHNPGGSDAVGDAFVFGLTTGISI
jgi:porin